MADHDYSDMVGNWIKCLRLLVTQDGHDSAAGAPENGFAIFEYPWRELDL